jgi:hypothetical protein
MGVTLIKADMSFNEIQEFPNLSTFTELLELNLGKNEMEFFLIYKMEINLLALMLPFLSWQG